MNKKTFLIITSIAAPNKVLQTYANESKKHGVSFIVIGDTKSPKEFRLAGCDFWSIDRQKELDFRLARSIPEAHYARKNIGYLLALQAGAEVIVETDDDNFPTNEFWNERELRSQAYLLVDKGWVNTYKYFFNENIWPRGFPLEHLFDKTPDLTNVGVENAFCPIQQGLSDENPDVDAIYRLTMPLPVKCSTSNNLALGKNSWCPFNTQNTTWFKVAFPLLYLPSSCSFRMTDIWRSFVAQRIAWTCDWNVLFHKPTVIQQRNEHNLLRDFEDEIPGYLSNSTICNNLMDLDLKNGAENVFDNLFHCYKKLVEQEYMDGTELKLLDSWVNDLMSFDIGY